MKKIWIITNQSNKLNWFWISRLAEEVMKMNCKFDIIAIEDINLFINDNWFEIYLNDVQVNLPNIVFLRNESSYKSICLIKYLKELWIKIINDINWVIIAKDKFLTQEYLSINHISVPKTLILTQNISINFIKNKIGFPLIIKNNWSHWEWILKINSIQEFKDIVSLLKDNMEFLKTTYLIQEYIWERPWVDLRVFVVWWKVVWSMIRKWKEWHFKSNFKAGGLLYKHDLTKIEEKIALDCAKIIWLNIVWVDILFDKNSGYKVCEINSSPWFEWLELITWLNIAKIIMEYVAKF